MVGVCRLGGGGVKKLETNATCTAVTVIRHGLTDTGSSCSFSVSV